MKTLIIYGTFNGYTKKCAQNLASKINGDTELCNVKENNKINLSKYSKVIIGGSIIASKKVQKEIVRFAKNNLNELLTKKIGLFVCCGDSETYMKYIKASFPKQLSEKAFGCECFGGDPKIGKMNPISKFITSIVFKIKGLPVPIPENIDKFAKKINNA